MEFARAVRARLAADRADGDELDRALQAALDRARAGWPELAVDEARFAEHLARVLGDAAAPADLLDQLHVADLYFTVACADGTPAALAALDRQHFAALRSPLSKMGLDASGIDETLQMVREELLAPRPGAAARILNYGGRGHLQGWLRSVAARTGLRLIHKTPRHDELDDRTPNPIDDDLELAYMKKTYGEAFHRAFRTALDELAADDRLLLKQRFRHRMTVEELGALHSVHAGTISRWVAAARERLVAATRVAMMRELGVGRDDVSSILRLIQSELDITLSSLGGDGGDGGDGSDPR